jgi:transposase
VYGLKHQKEKRSMDHFAGLDVSVKETSICIVDDTGRIVREVKVASEPEALLQVLGNPAYRFKRIGLEAGPLSQWLFSALAEAGLPVICVETRHMRAVLKAQINKTDRNDARGMAQMMRAGLYRPVHVKTLRSQKLRMLLTHRKLPQSKAIAIDNDLRGTLRNFGLKVGVVGAVKFEARIRELVENLPDLAVLVEPMLIVRRVLREQIVILHRRLLAIVRDDDVCRRLMTIPGVGPVVALTYCATVDVPARFRKSKAVGAVFGLTCSKYQSGESDWSGRISRCGDAMMRVMLYEAAQVMLTRTNKWSWLKAWAMQIARRRGMKKAIVALARRLAVILHRIWVDGTEFRWTRERENPAGSHPIGGNSSSTLRWNDVPRGTMDEVSSPNRLDLPFVTARPLGRLFRLVFDSHDGRAWCRFRREARARERHRHCCGGGRSESA